MKDSLIIEKAIEEIENKSWGVTEEFLKIHQLEYVDNKPVISRIDKNKPDGTVIIYFVVANEQFYFAVYLDTKPEISVRSIYIEPYHSVYFGATSDNVNFKELSNITTLNVTGGWNKGDKVKWAKKYYKNTCIRFEPNPKADEFEDKIEKLLDYLEQDKEGINQLVDIADGYVQVFSSFHNGNTMLGGYHLDLKTIKRLANLNLEIDFDICADGNFYKD